MMVYEELCRRHGWDALREEPLEATTKRTALDDLRKERDEARALAGDRPAHTSDPDYKRGRADGLDEAVKRLEEG